MNEKIYSLNSLVKPLTAHQAKGKKVVHCHGVFDVIHLGHIKYLEAAKTHGDILVVTLTQDQHIHKGPGRPVFSEKIRSECIAALECVDYVAINEWASAEETILALKPNIYVKGPDYKTLENDLSGNIFKEKEAILAVNGEMKFTNTELYSSSKIVNQLFSPLSDDQLSVINAIKSKYSHDEIMKYFDKMDALTVTTIGEAIIDNYIFCNTLGKSGKDSLLMSQELSSERYAGGILAIANHLSDFVQSIQLLTYVGDTDDHTKFIQSKLNTNIQFDPIIKPNSPTIMKKRYIESYNKTKLFGTYIINDSFIDTKRETELIDKINQHAATSDIVVLTDYGHGLLTPKVIETIQNYQKKLIINTQVNAANIGYYTVSKYKNTRAICMHEGELRQEFRNRSNDIRTLIEQLSISSQHELIIVTRGNKGAIAYQNQTFYECPAFSTDIVDRLGSGDTFLSICALCIEVGMPIDLLLLISNLAGAYAVKKMGTGHALSKHVLIKTLENMLK